MDLQKRLKVLCDRLTDMDKTDRRLLAQNLFMIIYQANRFFDSKAKRTRLARLKFLEPLFNVLMSIESAKTDLAENIPDIIPYPGESINNLTILNTNLRETTTQLVRFQWQLNSTIQLVLMDPNGFSPEFVISKKIRKTGRGRREKIAYKVADIDQSFSMFLDKFLTQVVILLERNLTKPGTLPYIYLSQFLDELLQGEVKKSFGSIKAESLRKRVKSFRRKNGNHTSAFYVETGISRLVEIIGWQD